MICQDSLLYVSYPVKSQWQSKLVVYVEHLATGRHIASFDGQMVHMQNYLECDLAGKKP
jgi:hypothetical protein